LSLSRRAVLTMGVFWIGLAGCAPQRRAQAPAAIPPASASQAGAHAASPAPDKEPAPPPAPENEPASSPEAPPASDSQGARPAAKTPDEQREALDRHLEASLAEFDAMLLKEQQEAAAKRAEHATAPAGGSEGGEGEGTGGSGDGGKAGDAAGAKTTGSAAGAEAGRGRTEQKGDRTKGDRTKDQSTGTSQAGGEPDSGREATTAPEGDARGAGDSSRVPVDVGDGRDDDVVARQLREAAMKEEDPVIREKLWDEYRRYKRGS
jgi:hypothetical protein